MAKRFKKVFYKEVILKEEYEKPAKNVKYNIKYKI